jgi:hypothetical protein
MRQNDNLEEVAGAVPARDAAHDKGLEFSVGT